VTGEDVMAVDRPLYLQSLDGGLIGASAVLFRLSNGPIAGISGIVGGLLGSGTRERAEDRGGVALDRFIPLRNEESGVWLRPDMGAGLIYPLVLVSSGNRFRGVN
jgi:hypothetical protein